MNAQYFCQYCGSTMEPDWQFCESCGGQPAVPEPAPTVIHPPVLATPAQRPTPVQTSTPQSVPVQPRQSAPKRSRNWLLPVGIGCVALVCMCGIATIGLYLLFSQNTVVDALTPTLIAEITSVATEVSPPSAMDPTITIAPESTDIPVSTEAPALPEAASPTPWPTALPTETHNALTGNQYRDEFSIFDDFSSNALAWPEIDDGVTLMKYENQSYSIQIAATDFYDWAYVPVDFWPNAIQFDVLGLPGAQDGTFGVMCQYQDLNNYNYVEIDLGTREFVLGQIRADEFIPLTIPDENGQYWLSADPLYPSPEQVNRIDLLCYPDYMMLAINDALVYHVTVSEPFPNPGEMAFFVYAFDFAGPGGYKVFFDNVGVQQDEE